MNPRERSLALVLLVGGILVGGYLIVNQLVLKPLRQYDQSIALLRDKNREKSLEYYRILSDKPKLERWRLVPQAADNPDTDTPRPDDPLAVIDGQIAAIAQGTK